MNKKKLYDRGVKDNKDGEYRGVYWNDFGSTVVATYWKVYNA
ncbi:hypothetical protein K144313037_p10260 (plasmid) [Clostridium tetani]|nr:hypothetical protein [Clostridium tetani]WFN63262.1 hypothetical protein PAA20_13905 [Clostridium tetani]SUY80161.1 Uncharacterised protein [Clostridium tetani]BDR71159.1 hypothetical protein K144313037_p10260 [Clostridium tetani]BDR79700.1 hypothetical protein K154307017_p10260 [Clostridium tetani]BEV20796.1 hypothetical protein K154301001_26510 [Clostridium tetani]